MDFILQMFWKSPDIEIISISLDEIQPCAIENLHLGVAKQVSVEVGWVKIKILLMAQLKGLTAKFKLM